MKQCPNCQGFELYDDDIVRCPHCDTVLIPYKRRPRVSNPINNPQQPITPNPIPSTSQQQNDDTTQAPKFQNSVGRRNNYRGIINSINPTSRFIPSIVKWFNAFFRGQPYQFGNPVHETTIRIEEITDSRIPNQMRNLVFYGEVGDLNVGDDVTVSTVSSGGRLIIRDLYIHDVETTIQTRGVSAWGVRILTLAAIGLIVFLFAAIISFFSSGGFWTVLDRLMIGLFNLLIKIIIALSPIGALLFVYWMFFRKK